MNTKDYQRSETVFFKNIGIAGLDSDTFVPRIDQYVTNRTTWRVRRLSSIMKELGHKPVRRSRPRQTNEQINKQTNEQTNE